jgi:predicted aminopeptidase
VKKTFRFLLFALLVSTVLVSCETVSYYGQAVAGQLYIFSHRENIEALIENQNTSPELKNKLETILEIRTFAEQELLLPLDKNYSTYVDVQRPYVVWNVFATPEFSMQANNWCYPIAGCVSYRGYFSEVNAREFAENLNAQGQDVYVGGVAAYSTLGWFSDSILNTVIAREDHQLASLLFHELAHQLLYIPGDTEFNESFATAVEQEGLKRWLQHTRTNNAEAEAIVSAAELDRERRLQFVEVVSETVAALKQLYASDGSEQAMRQSKQEQIAHLQENYIELKNSWNGYDGYDAWFKRDINNAQLNTVTTYFNWVPAFEAMLVEEANDLPAFYARVLSLENLEAAERRASLESAVN